MRRSRGLKDKVAVLTGAGSGIGRATALRFAEEGTRLILTDVDGEGLQETLRLVKSQGGEAVTRETDVSVEEQVRRLMDWVLETGPCIDILCNIAGIAGHMTTLESQDADDWLRVFQVNLMGVVFTTKYVARHMQERRSGVIVNVASVAGIRSGAGGNAYSASKAGVINFTRTAACDLGGYQIRVNAVCPGLIETGMTKEVFDYARKVGKEKKLGYRCELRRYGRPEEIASVIVFLASEDASYITGQAIAVDGGNTASLNLPGMKF